MFTEPKEGKDTYRLTSLLSHLNKYKNSNNEDALHLGRLIHQKIQNKIRTLNPYSVVEPAILVYSKDLDINIAMHGDVIINNTLYEIKSKTSLINNKDYCLAQASTYFHAFKKTYNLDNLRFIQYDILQNIVSVHPLSESECYKVLNRGLANATKSNEQFYLLKNNLNSNNDDLITIKKSDIVKMLLMLRDDRKKELEQYMIDLYNQNK